MKKNRITRIKHAFCKCFNVCTRQANRMVYKRE